MRAPLPPDVSFERTLLPMNSIRFLLRRGMLMTAVIAMFTILAACSTPAETGGDASDEPGNTGGGTVVVTDGMVEISADNTAFDASVIEAPAGKAFTISFTNNESAQHNVAVYTEEGGDEIVIGEYIGEGVTTEVQVPALDAGEYFFVCDIHPEMNGTVVVTEG
jgi:plastocyanin